MAVVATLSRGYDLDYIWRQVDCGPAKDAAGYYFQASESGGELPGRWWGPGAKALGLEHGQIVEREPYDLLFGERKAPDGTQLGRPPGSGHNTADIYARLRTPARTADRSRPPGPPQPAVLRPDPVAVEADLHLSRLAWERTPALPAKPGWAGVVPRVVGRSRGARRGRSWSAVFAGAAVPGSSFGDGPGGAAGLGQADRVGFGRGARAGLRARWRSAGLVASRPPGVIWR